MEEKFPRRIHLTLYNEDGTAEWESGWHGIAGKDICNTQVAKPKNKFKPRESRINCDIGDEIISLDGFRFTGTDAEWTHCCELLCTAGGTDYELQSCQCGTRHKVKMHELIGPFRIPDDVLPGPTVVMGCCTR